MSDQPAGPPGNCPDPTRDASVAATTDATGTMSAMGAATPVELPDTPDDVYGQGAPAGPPAYDTFFGRETPAEPSWVPQRSAAHSLGHVPPQPGPPVPPGPRTVELGGGHAARLLGGRLQTWHVVAIVLGVLVPIGVWAASGLTDDLDPVARPAVSVTRHRPTATRTTPLPTAPMPTRSGTMPLPKVVTVPAIPVTPVPANARTIRFEAYAEKGARIEVSLSDAAHHRYDYPAQAAPLAFETPVDPGATNNDYFSLRVRISDPTGSGVTGAVSCRIVVDGVAVTAQQGQDYATCSISPYFDIRRR